MATPLLANKYLLLKRIASGGMAEIFLAKQVGIDGFEKLVVVKRILPKFASQPEYVRMFLDEARTAADLRHPNIVATFEVGEENLSYFMVMEYLHGLDLRLIFRRLSAHEHKIPIEIAVGIVTEICAGLHYAHKKTDLKGNPLGIVHRDISPQNVVLTFDGETKIVDFGIAQGAHLHEQDPQGVLKGKFGYMSPEQASGEELDQKTDQFSLGVILYELTTMRRLFRRNGDEDPLAQTAACEIAPPSSMVEGYHPELEQIVMRALSKDRALRFESCEALRLALFGFLTRNAFSYSRDQLSVYLRQHFRQEEEQSQEALSRVDHVSLKPSYLAKETLSHLSHKQPEKVLKWSHVSFAVFAVVLLGLAIGAGTFFLTNRSQASTPAPSAPATLVQAPVLVEEPAVQSIGAPELAEAKAPPPVKTEKKKFGRVKIAVEPWGEIYIDGKLIGLTPLAPQKMSEGHHIIRIKNARLGPDKTLKVLVQANKDTLVRYSFD